MLTVGVVIKPRFNTKYFKEFVKNKDKNIKNLYALFSSPHKVILNTEFLTTLPKKDVLSGLGESLKLSIIGGRKSLESLEYFLKIMDITEKEFMEIALKHQISPWQYDDTLVSEGKKLHDQDQWDDTPIR